jgi:hypothetical protein
VRRVRLKAEGRTSDYLLKLTCRTINGMRQPFYGLALMPKNCILSMVADGESALGLTFQMEISWENGSLEAELTKRHMFRRPVFVVKLTTRESPKLATDFFVAFMMPTSAAMVAGSISGAILSLVTGDKLFFLGTMFYVGLPCALVFCWSVCGICFAWIQETRRRIRQRLWRR